LSSAAKKKPEELKKVAPSELSSDREQGLSQNFEDPALDDLLAPPGGQPSPMSLVEETVEAVQELVQEAAAPADEAVDLSQDFSSLDLHLLNHDEADGSEAAKAMLEPDTGEVEALPLPTAAPRRLPASVNPNADKERSMLLSLPKDAIEEPVSVLMIDGGAVETARVSGHWEMAEKLFQLVVCERTFEDVVESGLGAIMNALHAQAGSVLELDLEHDNFFFRCSLGGASPPERLKAFRVPRTKGIVGHVAESRQPLLLRDLTEDQMQMKAISMSVGFEAVTCMAAPILVGGQLFGVVELFNKKDGGFFEEKDLRAFEDGVWMLAKVLEVRFLMAELLRRAG
jgi:GAF domain-containing protein